MEREAKSTLLLKKCNLSSCSAGRGNHSWGTGAALQAWNLNASAASLVGVRTAATGRLPECALSVGLATWGHEAALALRWAEQGVSSDVQGHECSRGGLCTAVVGTVAVGTAGLQCQLGVLMGQRRAPHPEMLSQAGCVCPARQE